MTDNIPTFSVRGERTEKVFKQTDVRVYMMAAYCVHITSQVLNVNPLLIPQYSGRINGLKQDVHIELRYKHWRH